MSVPNVTRDRRASVPGVHKPSERLAAASLYLCTDARRERGDLAEFADARAGGRSRHHPAARQGLGRGAAVRSARGAGRTRALEVLADAARRHDALLAVNDRADIALAAGADVLHLGQDDLPLPFARDIVGSGPGDRPVDPRHRPGRGRHGRRRSTTSASAPAGRHRPSRAEPRPASTSSAPRPNRERTSPGSPSAASTRSACPRCSLQAHSESSSCGRSRRQKIPGAAAEGLKARLAEAG